MKRRIKSWILPCLVVWLCITANPARGQDNTVTKRYVKMEVGAMGLHCPFLGVTLKEQLQADTLFSELKVDKTDHFLTFAYIDSEELTADYFQKIAVRVGYPAEIIIVTLFDSQPTIDVKKK